MSIGGWFFGGGGGYSVVSLLRVNVSSAVTSFMSLLIPIVSILTSMGVSCVGLLRDMSICFVSPVFTGGGGVGFFSSVMSCLSACFFLGGGFVVVVL